MAWFGKGWGAVLPVLEYSFRICAAATCQMSPVNVPYQAMYAGLFGRFRLTMTGFGLAQNGKVAGAGPVWAVVGRLVELGGAGLPVGLLVGGLEVISKRAGWLFGRLNFESMGLNEMACSKQVAITLSCR